ncbi:golgin subfamily A member 6-like protein 24 [Poeciliopsis prolifica]|uniref:golgin subfamily A member 6-like protein 24 n=1 Tax=Poeciliopsis prolifica TaxID=188132 RepID=UPI00241415C1|nr:golgin subfamily A member 6-like protein 24 [Poeciliopsis prolifica]XP_054881122.1 golgin subfamily A member 6-like protein 24 [Poeciliopsis prolifica]
MSQNTERHQNRRLAHLEEELEETKFQLQKQTELKVGFFNKAHRATEELKRLQRYTDTETLKVVAIACQAHFSVEDLDKEELQQKYEDLKVSQFHIQDALLAEMHDEKQRNKVLEDKLDDLKASYEELRRKYEADVGDEAKLHEEQSLEKLRVEKDNIIHDMTQKIDLLQENEKRLQDELEESKRGTNEQSKLINELKQQAEIYQDKIKKAEAALYKERKENVILGLNYTVLIEQFEKLETQKETLMEKSEEDTALVEEIRKEYAILQRKANQDAKFLKKNAKILKKELDESKTFYNKLKLKFNLDITGLKEEMERCKQKVQQEKDASLQSATEKQQLIDSLRQENAVLEENTRREIQVLQDKDRNAQDELETLRVLFKELQCSYIHDVNMLKTQAEQFQEEISRMKQELETTRDKLQPDTEEDQHEDQETTVSQQEEEKNRVDPVMDSSHLISSEEDLAREPIPGCSNDLESIQDDIDEETIQQDLETPDMNSKQEGKKKKPKTPIWKKIRNIFRLKKTKKTTQE